MSAPDTPAVDPGHALDDPEVHSAVHDLVAQMVDPARARHGPLPSVGSDHWWRAPADVQLASLLVLAEAWVVYDPERAVRERLRSLSTDLSGAADWSAIARAHVTPDGLEHRRAAPGPLARAVDPAVAARWAATGTTEAEGRTA